MVLGLASKSKIAPPFCGRDSTILGTCRVYIYICIVKDVIFSFEFLLGFGGEVIDGMVGMVVVMVCLWYGHCDGMIRVLLFVCLSRGGGGGGAPPPFF